MRPYVAALQQLRRITCSFLVLATSLATVTLQLFHIQGPCLWIPKKLTDLAVCSDLLHLYLTFVAKCNVLLLLFYFCSCTVLININFVES